MNYRRQHTSSPAITVHYCQLWSAHLDALERHLSAKTWALAGVTVALIAYPIAQIVIPAIRHGIVPHGTLPDVVRVMLNLS